MWRRVLSAAAAASVAAVLGVLVLGPGAASPAWAASGSPVAPGAVAGVDDFVVESFDATYTLGRDADGRSVLHTVERIDILFPDFDQNRGFIRDLVRVFDGHPTDVEVVAVTDAAGTPRAFTTEASGDVVSVTIAVPEGSFVHGQQSYLIEYTQRDVTFRPSDANIDEFTWDVNGTGWRQPFLRVSARVVLDASLVPALTGAASCYRGPEGSTQQCAIAREADGVSVDESTLGLGENVTLSVGFEPGTFAERPFDLFERVPPILLAGLTSLGAAIALIVSAVVQAVRGPRTGRAIIAQYEPPEGMNVAVAAEVLRVRPKAMTAMLLDLAVRGNIRLLFHDETGLYGAHPVTDEGLDEGEQSVFRLLFAGSGDNVWFGPSDTRLGDTRVVMLTRSQKEAMEAGLLQRPSRWVTRGVPVLIIGALIASVIGAMTTQNEPLAIILTVVGVNVLVWLLLFLGSWLATLRRRTDEGALLHDHLMGLREYIRLAEADRIRMLQSASGAEVTADHIVKVYEKLLPYAVLFGLEDEWQAELARYYAESTPQWMSGSPTSRMPLRSFQTTVSQSPRTITRSSSGSSGSSSRSSSSGGGSSGGGGGGGGGRGI